MVPVTETTDGDVAELAYASLARLLFLRATFRPADPQHPYSVAIVKQLARRTAGARTHRCLCRLAPGQVCGMSFHTHVDAGGLASLSRPQRERITAAARQSLPAGFALEFAIEPSAPTKPHFWSYAAFCNGDIFAHGIVVRIMPRAAALDRVFRTNFENDDESRRVSCDGRQSLKRKLDAASWPLNCIRTALRSVENNA